jgi:hypothetical protein
MGYKIQIFNFKNTPCDGLVNALESLEEADIVTFHCVGEKCGKIELAEALKNLQKDHERRKPKLTAAYRSPTLMINTISYDPKSKSCALCIYLQLQPIGIHPDTYFTIELQL